ncbi:hypothetical protein KEM52_005563 [Ascosphaera acerosa]|nr:hypothetical protein KEM52_005563 [Ascosphaera acerosa]
MVLGSIDPDDYVPAQDEQFFLAVDGGATKTSATVAAPWGKSATGCAGPSNICYASVAECMAVITAAATKAITEFTSANGMVADREEMVQKLVASTSTSPSPSTSPRGQGQPPSIAPSGWKFGKVWIGLAGIDQVDPRKKNRLAGELQEAFAVSLMKGSLMLTHDDLLLSSALYRQEGGRGEGETEAEPLRSGVALIAGTGAVAAAFRVDGDGETHRLEASN